LAPYFLISTHTEVTPLRMCVCVMLHTLGVVVMMASDTQKYFVLKVKKGLIDDGWFYNCRTKSTLSTLFPLYKHSLIFVFGEHFWFASFR
jgi:hypothetical protein